MIEIQSIVPVLAMQDRNRAIAFYTTVFGAKIKPYNEENGLWWMELGKTNLIIYTSETPVLSKHTTVRFVVDNIHQAVNEVQSYGLVFFGKSGQEAVDFGTHYSAWFKDTEGNSIELTQIK